MEKMKMHSPNLTRDNIARIRELFPGCVTEAAGDDGKVRPAVDFDLLRQELSDSIVEGPQERYHLDWPGKREALRTANAWSTTITLPRRRQLHFPKQERAGTIGQERSKRGFAPVSLTFCPPEAYLSLFHPLRSFS